MPRMKSKTNSTIKGEDADGFEIEVNTDFERKLAESIAERLELLAAQIADLATVREELVGEQAKLIKTLKALGNS